MSAPADASMLECGYPGARVEEPLEEGLRWPVTVDLMGRRVVVARFLTEVDARAYVRAVSS